LPFSFNVNIEPHQRLTRPEGDDNSQTGQQKHFSKHFRMQAECNTPDRIMQRDLNRCSLLFPVAVHYP